MNIITNTDVRGIVKLAYMHGTVSGSVNFKGRQLADRMNINIINYRSLVVQ